MDAVIGNVEGQVAVVTGAGNGIGRAIARRLAELGVRVCIAEKDETAGRNVAQEICGRGGEAVALSVDVSVEADVDRMVSEVEKRWGKLDALVNNAGVELFRSLEETAPADWDRVMAVDLKGVYLCSRAAIPLMRRTGGGSIVHIASNHAQATIPEIGAYAAAKGGVVSLTRSMALEVGKDRIRVNAVCPGFIRTSKLDSFLEGKPDRDGLLEYYTTIHPLGRMGTPEDVAHFVAFLISPYTEFVTGGCFIVDGGLTARLF